MQAPEVPENESFRLFALERLNLVYSPAEARFDRITRLVARHFKVDFAVCSLVFDHIQWFKSTQGLNACSTSRDVSFCGHAILQDDVFVIENALMDPRFADNPLVTDDPKIRFYAGYPVRDHRKFPLGTLCLIHSSPRGFTEDEKRDLRDFGKILETELTRVMPESVQSRYLSSMSEQQRAIRIDPVVGTWNRKGLEELMALEVAQSRMIGQSLCLLRAKIVNFNQILSRYGNERMIDFSKFVASIIREELLDSDSLGTVVADQFLAILPTRDESEIRQMIQRLQFRFANITLETHGVRALVDVDFQLSVLELSELQQDGLKVVENFLSVG